MTSQNVNTDTFSNISIDIETFSDADLKKCGVYKYAESPNFEILLFAYSLDNGPVQVIDLAQGEEIPESILAALSDNRIEKWAYNASFERICLSEYLRKHHPEHFVSYSIDGDTVSHYLDPSAWKCSRIWGAYMGLPLSLEGIGAVLKLQDQKMKEGKDLIRYFCVPCKPTKTNGGRERNLPEHAPDKWDVFKSYNIRDVEVELAIKDKLRLFPVPDFVWDEYHLDQEINDRGIAVDMQLVDNAVNLDAITKDALMGRMQDLTGLDNPNSVAQMKDWLSDNGIETESLDKKAVKDLKGVFNTIRFVSRQMLKQRAGRIINMASVVGVCGNAGQVNYAASKAGVIGMTKTVAKELASRGITVNAVAPGFIETDMTNKLSDKVKEMSVAQIPLGRFGKPENIAKTVCFLASDDAEYITGQVINVDGGMVM